MAFVDVVELRKVYRVGAVEVQALRGLSLSVDEGELVSLIGPSGSGKTTLLNIIGGLLQATSGNVRVGTQEVTAMTPDELVTYRLRSVGHVFQSLNLVSFLTVAENVALPLIGLGVASRDRAARVDELLAAMGLNARRRHRPQELSGGEQQRVAIAAALANNPPFLLADEPTGELDTETTREIVEYLKRVHEEHQKTILLVTHNPSVARVGGQILRIADGRIGGSYRPEPIDAQTEQDTLARHLHHRLTTIRTELARLDARMKAGTIQGENYARHRTELREVQKVLRTELHRLGIT